MEDWRGILMSEQNMGESTVITSAQLDELIEEATTDCYDEEEQATGLLTMIDENLALPFATRILGVDASVIAIVMDDYGRLKAVCEHGGEQQSIDLLDLPLPLPPPSGAEWIAAYRRWTEGSGYDEEEDDEEEHDEEPDENGHAGKEEK
jgi:hypothetical protein